MILLNSSSLSNYEKKNINAINAKNVKSNFSISLNNC